MRAAGIIGAMTCPRWNWISAFAGMTLGLLAAAPLHAATATLSFRGYAYELSSNRFLYTELHRQEIDGERWVGGTIDYIGPDGARIGYKTLDFSRHPYVPLYRLDLVATGYAEGITGLTADRIEMIKRANGGGEPQRASVPLPATVAADSGFHAFLRDRFTELMAGRTVNFVFAVAGSLDTFRFRARRIAAAEFEGKPALRLRVEPDSMLRWLVEPLELTYDPAQRRLLEYRGVSNIHDPATGKAYNARIVYPSSPPADAPALPAGL